MMEIVENLEVDAERRWGVSNLAKRIQVGIFWTWQPVGLEPTLSFRSLRNFPASFAIADTAALLEWNRASPTARGPEVRLPAASRNSDCGVAWLNPLSTTAAH